MGVRDFVNEHYRHFNAGTLQRASASLTQLLEEGGKVFLTLAGAMSTAEIGRSLADMIRAGHIAAISCTGANLEEDVFNLVAHHHYEKIPNYEDLGPQDEVDLLNRHLNRVTDTCIPEEEAIRAIEAHVLDEWKEASDNGTSHLPHEFLYRLLRSGQLEDAYQADPSNAWLLAAAEVDLPLFVPGWEDSTLGNIFAARCSQGIVKPSAVLSGVHYMTALMEFYRGHTAPLAFLQVGGGIAGDFPICVVPLLHQDLEETHIPLWSWFAQITDATASYGGYSGAPPNEKITWGKLGPATPRFNIQSDASIVLPLIFGFVLDA
ncbi:MAG: deoxyhypusine synthase family protein [Poseidonia sp.]